MLCVCVCMCQGGIFWANRLWWGRLQRIIKLLWCRGWQSVRDYRQTGSGSACVLCFCVCVFLSAPYPPHRWRCSSILPLPSATSSCFLLPAATILTITHLHFPSLWCLLGGAKNLHTPVSCLWKQWHQLLNLRVAATVKCLCYEINDDRASLLAYRIHRDRDANPASASSHN